jgi:hypothetical protein
MKHAAPRYPISARSIGLEAYSDKCPVCHALPRHYCTTRDGRLSRYAHSLRGRPEVSTMPDLSGWWKAMRKYEGQFAQPRPAGLVIP